MPSSGVCRKHASFMVQSAGPTTCVPPHKGAMMLSPKPFRLLAPLLGGVIALAACGGQPSAPAPTIPAPTAAPAHSGPQQPTPTPAPSPPPTPPPKAPTTPHPPPPPPPHPTPHPTPPSHP